MNTTVLRDWFAQIYGLPSQPHTTLAMEMREYEGKVLGYLKPDRNTDSFAWVFNAKKQWIGSLVFDAKWNYCHVLSKNEKLLKTWARTYPGKPEIVFRFGFPIWCAPDDFIFCPVDQDLDRLPEEELIRLS